MQPGQAAQLSPYENEKEWRAAVLNSILRAAQMLALHLRRDFLTCEDYERIEAEWDNSQLNQLARDMHFPFFVLN